MENELRVIINKFIIDYKNYDEAYIAEEIADAVTKAGYRKIPDELPLINDEALLGICERLSEAAKTNELKVSGINEATWVLVQQIKISQRDADLRYLRR